MPIPPFFFKVSNYLKRKSGHHGSGASSQPVNYVGSRMTPAESTTSETPAPTDSEHAQTKYNKELLKLQQVMKKTGDYLQKLNSNLASTQDIQHRFNVLQRLVSSTLHDHDRSLTLTQKIKEIQKRRLQASILGLVGLCQGKLNKSANNPTQSVYTDSLTGLLAVLNDYDMRFAQTDVLRTVPAEKVHPLLLANLQISILGHAVNCLTILKGAALQNATYIKLQELFNDLVALERNANNSAGFSTIQREFELLQPQLSNLATMHYAFDASRKKALPPVAEEPDDNNSDRPGNKSSDTPKQTA